ncbi:hypothetical protein AB0B89_23980 [Sphaerisporangium sp. NPDC049002]|uniref:hypothetical protein n=1 Tax=unclassified Sphaerisporangium TaxID=2630420 RepID=UPI0033E13441
MDMSWQTTFALACAAVFAAIVPGTLGYTSARLETAAQQRQELVRLRAELQTARQAVQQVSTPCKAQARSGDSTATGPSDDQAVPAPGHPQAKSDTSVDPPADAPGTDPELDPGLGPRGQE